MKPMHFFLLLAVLLTAGRTTAQDAHSNIIDDAFADMRGQVFMTIDRDETAKVWNIADGKMVASFSKKTADWHPKLLRYKINHKDYTLKGFESKLTYDNGFVNEIRIDGKLVGKIRKGGGSLWNPETKKLLLQSSGGNTPAEYYTTLKSARFISDKLSDDDDDDGNNNVEVKFLLNLPYIAQYETSPKSTWLISVRAQELMNFETNKVTKIPSDANMLTKEWMRFTRYAFNPEETMLAVSTQEGISVIDIATATVVKKIALPKKIKEKEGYLIYPLSDMETFVYTGTRYDWGEKGTTKKAWLVKESGATALSE